MHARIILLLFGVMTGTVAVYAADPAPDGNLAAGFPQVGPQLTPLGEVQQQREESAAAPAGMATEYAEAAPALAGAAPVPRQGATSDEFYTLEELRGEMKKIAWTKGDFRIVPYGTLWANMVYETERTNPGDYTLYVLSRRDDLNQQFHVDARSTRLGIDISGPPIPLLNCAQSGGKVEIDFQRQIDTENKPTLLLRHAYVEVKNDEFRLLAGQTWDVISPLYPGMLMYSVGWGGGNIGYRRPQLRGERYLDFSDTCMVILQGSLNADIISDTGASFTTTQAGWPVLEGRIGTTLGERGKGCLPLDLGVSAHIGETIYDITSPFRDPVTGLVRPTWSLNADFRYPLTERLGVQGEFFTGENLAPFLGGILQGVDIGTPTKPGTREAIHSTGGWAEVWYDWSPRLHSHGGYSIDDPVNADIVAGRVRNSFYFGNLIYDVTQRFLVGVEVSYWQTLYKGAANGESVHTDFVAKYSF